MAEVHSIIGRLQPHNYLSGYTPISRGQQPAAPQPLFFCSVSCQVCPQNTQVCVLPPLLHDSPPDIWIALWPPPHPLIFPFPGHTFPGLLCPSGALPPPARSVRNDRSHCREGPISNGCRPREPWVIHSVWSGRQIQNLIPSDTNNIECWIYDGTVLLGIFSLTESLHNWWDSHFYLATPLQRHRKRLGEMKWFVKGRSSAQRCHMGVSA